MLIAAHKFHGRLPWANAALPDPTALILCVAAIATSCELNYHILSPANGVCDPTQPPVWCESFCLHREWNGKQQWLAFRKNIMRAHAKRILMVPACGDLYWTCDMRVTYRVWLRMYLFGAAVAAHARRSTNVKFTRHWGE